MYKAIVYSVPGTGTRFANNFLESCLSYQNAHTREHLLASHRERVYMPTHSWHELAPIAGFHGIRLVVPLRNPYTAYVTRSRNHRSIDGGMVKTAGFWKLLMDAEDKFEMCFLPVDHVNIDRKRLLHSVANHLECDYDEVELDILARTWRKIGSMGPSTGKGEWEKSRTIRGETPTFLKDAEEWYWTKIEELENL